MLQLRAITIENFKSIKDPVRIELKPITLLYGPNSSGKSTIIQALHYVREILLYSDVNADLTGYGGDTIRLGGFINLVHNRDINNQIRFKLEFGGPEYYWREDFDDHAQDINIENSIAQHDNLSDRIIELYSSHFKKGQLPWLELILQQDNLKQDPYLSTVSLGFSEEPFMVFGYESEKCSHAKLLYLNLQHDIFPRIDGESIASLFLENSSLEDTHDEVDIICSTVINMNNQFYLQKKIPVGQGFNYSRFCDSVDENFKEQYTIFEGILATILRTAVKCFQEDLDDFRYIGPLREVPDDSFDPNSKKAASWDKGLAAWARMVRYDGETCAINEFFSEQPGSEYEIIRKQYKELDINASLYKNVIGEDQSLSEAEIHKKIAKLPIKNKIYLKSPVGGVELQPKDVGVGISQVIPIIPLALGGGHDHDGIIAIEQPELHIHPAIQLGLGDLFIEGLETEHNALSRKRFILETHSEHILLRLLRRIREPKEGTIAKLEAEDLGIYFLETRKNGLKVNRIRVNEEGEFKDPWPSGFFNERVEELF